MKIGNLELKEKTVLAPLAGITNLPFRLMVKEAGCALLCSEMISSNGLFHKSEKTYNIMNSSPEDSPLSIQIFGSDPGLMGEAAAVVEARGADIVDINFGCSVRKVLKTGSGSALMKHPKLAEKVIRAARDAVKIPLTIKIRTGWDKSGEDAFKIAAIAEANGVDAIAIHPRTAGQGFGGKADWSVIYELKKRVGIPVIGNGDILRAEDAISMMEQTGCNAVMIGRAVIGNPWIFSQVHALLRGETPRAVTLDMRFKGMEKYLGDSVRYFGEEQACYMMRSRLGWFSKGLPLSSSFRESIKMISSWEEGKSLIRKYQESLLDYLKQREKWEKEHKKNQ